MLNKKDKTDIIINSIKGLKILKSNSSNLPFQICWNKNRKFEYEHINKKIKLFIDCIKNTNQSWQEKFISNMKTINL